jgi:hypothetical protein
MQTRTPARFDFTRLAVPAFLMIVGVLVLGGVAIWVAAMR